MNVPANDPVKTTEGGVRERRVLEALDVADTRLHRKLQARREGPIGLREHAAQNRSGNR